MSSTRPASPSLPSLTGLRALAVTGVFLFHATAISVFANQSVNSAFMTATGNGSLAMMGVSFFFVLSGFVMVWSVRSDDTARRFWRRRAVRIFPNHLAVLALAACLLIAAGETIRIVPALANVALLQDWFPADDLIYYQLNVPTWSLSVEVFCYGAFPALYWLVQRIRPERLWYWGIGIALTALVLPLAVHPFLAGSPTSELFPGPSWAEQWLLYFFPPVRALEFVVGMIAARLVLAGRWVPVGLPTATLAVAAAYASLYFLPVTFSYAAVYPIPAALLICAAVRSDLRGRRTVLNNPAMVKLGEWSFAFYLVHLPVSFNLHAALNADLFGYDGLYDRQQFSLLPGIAFLLLLYALSWTAAALLRTYVETPAMHHWTRPKTPAPKPTPQPKAQL